MNLKLVDQLTESRLFPNKTALLRFDEKYLGEIVYLYTILIIAFSQEESEDLANIREMAMDYASRASVYRHFNTFRPTSNDLYLAAHQIIQGAEGDAERYISYENFDPQRLIRMLILTARGHSDKIPLNDILRLESQLRIKDNQLKQIRRTALKWDSVAVGTKVNTLRMAERILRRISMRTEMLPIVRRVTDVYRKGGIQQDVEDEKGGASVGKALAAIGIGLGAGLFLGAREPRSKK